MFRIASQVQPTDCLVVFAWEGEGFDETSRRHFAPWSGAVRTAHEMDDFAGKKGETVFLYMANTPAKRLLIVGLGKRDALHLMAYKQAIGTAIMALQSKQIERTAFVIPDHIYDKWDLLELGTQTAVATLLAQYSFDTYKTEQKAKVKPLVDVLLIANLDVEKKNIFEKGLYEGQILGESINAARELGNTPPSDLTPSYIANEVMKLDKTTPQLSVKILSRPEIQELGMGCFLGVAQGSAQEPKFIIIEYFAGEATEKPTVLVGKGITFDSGGLSLKPANYMVNMKFDMLGGATVYGVMKAISALGIKRNIVGLIPTCENMPSGTSYRPDDVLTAMNGKTVEIGNTDAEGRLILADALCYAKRYQPKEVIDFATLTGACVVALGQERSGLFTDERTLRDRLLKSSETVGEQLWQLPLGEEFHEMMKSKIADIKNASDSPYGGASTAAAFLQFFTEYPWAHIDLSSSYYVQSGKPWIRTGANGFGIQTMVNYLQS